MDRASRGSGEAIYGQGTFRAGVAAGGEGLLDRSIGRGTLGGGEPEVAVGVIEDVRALVARVGTEVDVLGVRQVACQAIGVDVDVSPEAMEHDLGVAASTGVVQRVQMGTQMNTVCLLR